MMPWHFAVPVGDGDELGLASGRGLGAALGLRLVLGLEDGEGDCDGERTRLAVPCGVAPGWFPGVLSALGWLAARAGGAFAEPREGFRST